MKKILGSVMIAGLLFAGTACGGDDESSSTNAPASEETTGGGGGDSENQAVADYCAEAEQLGKDLKEIMADPTKGDVAAVTAQAQELVAAAQALITANADDVDEITACSNKITEAMAG